MWVTCNCNVNINKTNFSASYELNLSYVLARMKPKNIFYRYAIKYMLQEISLKDRSLTWRALKLLFVLLNNLDIYRCTTEVMEIQLNYFIFLYMIKLLNVWIIKLLNVSKTKAFFWQFQVTFHMYLNIGRDDDDDYDNGESSDEDCYD